MLSYGEGAKEITQKLVHFIWIHRHGGEANEPYDTTNSAGRYRLELSAESKGYGRVSTTSNSGLRKLFSATARERDRPEREAILRRRHQLRHPSTEKFRSTFKLNFGQSTPSPIITSVKHQHKICIRRAYLKSIHICPIP